MRYLTIGALPLYDDGFTVLNEGGLLSWEQPSRTFTTRGNYQALVSGEAWAGTPATIVLKIMVSTSSVEATQYRMERLHSVLYSVKYYEPLSPNNGRMGVFDLRDGYRFDESYVLKGCTLSSDVDIKRYDGGKTYVCTFTVTSTNPYWRKYNPETVDLTQSVVKTFSLGGSPTADYQIIFAIEDAVEIVWRDNHWQEYWRMNTAKCTGFSPVSGQTYYVRFDATTGTAGWVTSPTQFSGTIPQTTLGYLTHLVVQPRSGFALYPNNTGIVQTYITGATTAKLRYYPNKAVI